VTLGRASGTADIEVGGEEVDEASRCRKNDFMPEVWWPRLAGGLGGSAYPTTYEPRRLVRINALFRISCLVYVVGCGWVLVGGGEVEVVLGADSAYHRAAVIAFDGEELVRGIHDAGGVLSSGDKAGQSE
jgi:hypothetical protein